ncbi:MAG: tRNA (N6-threonylcarbamoyladenosine(37)-N6)-methyltransferase TrmO [Alphaproteobacteria bacterium]|nr:tRNA (N6-threonylcarbamoyladenosine(37)-N6)-methyltransferase TrmO [Alphaproteobacteria bacterium]
MGREQVVEGLAHGAVLGRVARAPQQHAAGAVEAPQREPGRRAGRDGVGEEAVGGRRLGHPRGVEHELDHLPAVAVQVDDEPHLEGERVGGGAARLEGDRGAGREGLLGEAVEAREGEVAVARGGVEAPGGGRVGGGDLQHEGLAGRGHARLAGVDRQVAGARQLVVGGRGARRGLDVGVGVGVGHDAEVVAAVRSALVGVGVLGEGVDHLRGIGVLGLGARARAAGGCEGEDQRATCHVRLRGGHLVRSPRHRPARPVPGARVDSPPDKPYTDAFPPPERVELVPIGVVRSPYKERYGTPRQATVTTGVLGETAQQATIELFRDRVPVEAVRDLDGFGHIWVIAFLHLNQRWRPTVVPTRGPKVRRGVLATRAPHRPNQLGLSAVRLVGVEGHVLKVEGIDLLDGTPVLDIKPYVPYADAFPDTPAGWVDALEGEPDGPDRPTRPRGRRGDGSEA